MRLLSEARERLRALVFRAREERELAEELRFHIDMQTEANVRHGMSPAEARRQALIAFGGVARFTEEVRDARGLGPLEDLARDARHALRRLIREPGFSVPAAATLATGIGVAAAVFALVDAVLLRPLPYREADRLVTVGHAASRIELPMTGLSPGTFLHYRAHNRVFEDVAAYVEHVMTVADPGLPEQMRIAMVSPSFFPVLRVRAGVEAAEAANIGGFPLMRVPSYYNMRFAPADRAVQDTAALPYARLSFATPGYFQVMGIPFLSGRTFRTIDTSREVPGVIVSAGLARALFGHEDPVGRRVRRAGRIDPARALRAE